MRDDPEWSVHFRQQGGGIINARNFTPDADAGRRGAGRRQRAGPGPSALAANDPPQIGVVGKVKIPWFDNVEKGVLQAGKDLGVDAIMINPTTDDPAQQVRAIEDLIAKQVDVIGVVPNDGKALEPVLKRAQDAGIKVVMNESPGQKNADWDIELIQDQAFGEAHLEAFAEAIGGEGKYVVFVGGLTVALHNLWADYAVALQKEKYPEDAAGRRPLRRLEQRRRQLQDRDRPDAGQPGPQGLPDLRRQRPDRRRQRGVGPATRSARSSSSARSSRARDRS